MSRQRFSGGVTQLEAPETGDTAAAGAYTPGGATGTSVITLSAAHAFGQASVALGNLAAGDAVVAAWVEVTQAYNAGSTNVLTLGYSGSTSAYLGAADITEATPGVYPVGGKGPFPAETAARAVVVAFAQTGTPATTGAARAYVQVRKA
jgi:hypothetical protein